MFSDNEVSAGENYFLEDLPEQGTDVRAGPKLQQSIFFLFSLVFCVSFPVYYDLLE
jgi:hypothetical protein